MFLGNCITENDWPSHDLSKGDLYTFVRRAVVNLGNLSRGRSEKFQLLAKYFFPDGDFGKTSGKFQLEKCSVTLKKNFGQTP